MVCTLILWRSGFWIAYGQISSVFQVPVCACNTIVAGYCHFTKKKMRSCSFFPNFTKLQISFSSHFFFEFQVPVVLFVSSKFRLCLTVKIKHIEMFWELQVSIHLSPLLLFFFLKRYYHIKPAGLGGSV